MPKLPSIIDSLSASKSEEGSSYLFLSDLKAENPAQESQAGFAWVFPVMDTIPHHGTREVRYGRDTVFVFSRDHYRIYSNNKSLELNPEMPFDIELNSLKKMTQLKKDKPLVIAQRLVQPGASIPFNKKGWVVYDPQSSADGATAHGVLITSSIDSSQVHHQTPLTLDLGQRPSILRSPEIIPLTAKSSLSLVLNNPQSLLAKIKSIDTMAVLSPFIETIEEASMIEFTDGKALALKSLDLNMSLSTITQGTTQDDNFRGITLKSFEPLQLRIQPLPLIFKEIPQMTHAFVWDEFILLTPSEELAKNYIAELQNKNTLLKSNAWLATQEDLARESSLISWTKEAQIKRMETFQLIEDQGFAHMNYSLQTGGQKNINESIGPLLRSIQLDGSVLNGPQFSINHKSGGKNIIVQDENYRLYFIAPSGKTLWYRDLKEPILGSIQEVDLLRNGKKQLAFVTPSKWYVIDRNGRDVPPFSKSFKDPITQPLAVFDYDNNRKYRFVVIQDRGVLMYDAKGKQVKGFTYSKAPATVSQPPAHLRINGKDYLLFLLQNGQLQILSRTGKVRIPVSEQFDFGPNLPVKHEGKIVFWTQEGSQILISPEGTVIKRTAKSPAQYRVVYYGAHTLEFDDPLLRIDQNLIELPLGNYKGPQVFKFGNKLRVVMLDQDSQNIYIYNSEGNLLKDLPFFGSSAIDMADINNNGQLELVVQGQANEVLIYRLN